MQPRRGHWKGEPLVAVAHVAEEGEGGKPRGVRRWAVGRRGAHDAARRRTMRWAATPRGRSLAVAQAVDPSVGAPGVAAARMRSVAAGCRCGYWQLPRSGTGLVAAEPWKHFAEWSFPQDGQRSRGAEVWPLHQGEHRKEGEHRQQVVVVARRAMREPPLPAEADQTPEATAQRERTTAALAVVGPRRVHRASASPFGMQYEVVRTATEPVSPRQAVQRALTFQRSNPGTITKEETRGIETNV